MAWKIYGAAEHKEAVDEKERLDYAERAVAWSVRKRVHAIPAPVKAY